MSEEREPYLTNNEIVRALQALKLDDQEREQAIRDLRVVSAIELVADADDYALMLNAGDLGGVEL